MGQSLGLNVLFFNLITTKKGPSAFGLLSPYPIHESLLVFVFFVVLGFFLGKHNWVPFLIWNRFWSSIVHSMDGGGATIWSLNHCEMGTFLLVYFVKRFQQIFKKQIVTIMVRWVHFVVQLIFFCVFLLKTFKIQIFYLLPVVTIVEGLFFCETQMKRRKPNQAT